MPGEAADFLWRSRGRGRARPARGSPAGRDFTLPLRAGHVRPPRLLWIFRERYPFLRPIHRAAPLAHYQHHPQQVQYSRHPGSRESRLPPAGQGWLWAQRWEPSSVQAWGPGSQPGRCSSCGAGVGAAVGTAVGAAVGAGFFSNAARARWMSAAMASTSLCWVISFRAVNGINGRLHRRKVGVIVLVQGVGLGDGGIHGGVVRTFPRQMRQRIPDGLCHGINLALAGNAIPAHDIGNGGIHGRKVGVQRAVKLVGLGKSGVDCGIIGGAGTRMGKPPPFVKASPSRFATVPLANSSAVFSVEVSLTGSSLLPGVRVTLP